MKKTKRVFKSKNIKILDENGLEKEFDESERTRIANISFAYGNKKIINSLFKRGE